MSDDTHLGKKLQTPKGVHDILPDYHRYYTYIKKVMRHRCRQAGFRRISPPVFEFTEVFERGIGEETDIVSKEMYTFTDKGDNRVTLRPELTAGICRAYVQHGMKTLPQPVEFYAIEPVFRYDRPQKGRFRQFHQIDVEVIGEKDPAIDAQVIQLAWTIMKDLGIADQLEVHINSIGCNKTDRPKYIADLQDFFIGKERALAPELREKIHTNPLRLLDSKDEDCQILVSMAPKMKDYLSDESKAFYTDVKEFLTELNIPFVENENLVRGLDYYSHTVFEFRLKGDERAQNSLLGGGRYDGLIEILGGEPTPAIGWAAGVERIVATMKSLDVEVPYKDNLHLFVAQLGKEPKKKCLNIIQDLREVGVKVVGALGKGSIKAQMRLADKFNVPYVLILGVTEVREGVIILRDMKKGTQKSIPLTSVVDEVIKVIGKDNLDTYSPKELI